MHFKAAEKYPGTPPYLRCMMRVLKMKAISHILPSKMRLSLLCRGNLIHLQACNL